jgi:hypothetical protein
MHKAFGGFKTLDRFPVLARRTRKKPSGSFDRYGVGGAKGVHE